MSIGALSPQQLRSIVEEKWLRDETATAVGLHVSAPWVGPDEVNFEFGPARVVRADTVFGVRQALRDAEDAGGRIILLTRLQQADLGLDVVGRLARSRLFAIDHWASLCSLFRAKELDASICDPAIARALIEHAPPDGYPPVSAGLLDGGTVWRALGRHVFDMGESEPDLVSLLLWTTTRSGPSRYLSAPAELRSSLRQRLVSNLGDAAESLLRFVESGADALALAVACQLVYAPGDDASQEVLSARMEQYHGNGPIGVATGRRLGEAAAEAIAELDRSDDPQAAHRHLQRADDFFRQFRCEDRAYHSRLTYLGYEQRLGRLAGRLEAAVAQPGAGVLRECEALQAEVAAHRIARSGRRRDQVARTEMALRLARWLAAPPPKPGTFPEFAEAFRRELAFVDWSREFVVRGDEHPALSAAYLALDRAVLERRERFNRAFALALADWTATGSDSGLLRVEDVLPEVVAKVAGLGNRVLLIVLDGMSWSICHELLDDLRQDHWWLATLDPDASPPPPVIAAIPSVTSRSRTSLLSGVLTTGDASVEARHFEGNPGLRAVGEKKSPPLLFHKKDVTDGHRGAVDADLAKAILAPSQRVVGVVLNAIDDRLAGAEQIRDEWSLSRIGPLGPLLKLARDSGRVVILASDHGHVWHRPESLAIPQEDAGSRWRAAGAPPGEREVLLSGGRVRDGGGATSIVAAWSELLRYGRPQNGYHGGATPQEMVCPLVLLADRSSAYTGLFDCEIPRPGWWASAPQKSAAVRDAGRASPQPPPSPRRPATLFDQLDDGPDRDEAATSSWVDRLLDSPVYRAQRDLIRRHAPDDEVVRKTLAVLDANGGLMTPAAFSVSAEIQASRLDGLVARLQRLLNVDGYEILSMSRAENKLELNLARLRSQFELD